MPKVKVLLVDSDQAALKGLRLLFASVKGSAVCGAVTDSEEGLALVRELEPDVLVADIAAPGLSGLELARRVTARHPGTGVLLRGVDVSDRAVSEARTVGAEYIPKSSPDKAVVDAVNRLATAGASGHAPETSRRRRGYQVTPREREVIQMIAESKTSKEIATILGISVKTVETHRSNLMRKLRLHSVSETVRYAIRHSYVVP
jgi:DNA-binding NarL/FixJ family response regulator